MMHFLDPIAFTVLYSDPRITAPQSAPLLISKVLTPVNEKGGLGVSIYLMVQLDTKYLAVAYILLTDINTTN